MGFLKDRRAHTAARDHTLAGMNSEERIVTHAAAIATKEVRIRITDRRLLIMFVLLVAVVAYLLHNQATNFDSFKRVQKAANDRSRTNCQHAEQAFALVNDYFDGQEKIIRGRKDLPPAAKASLIGNLERSKLKPLDCS